jgi:N-acetylneuraminate synthase
MKVGNAIIYVAEVSANHLGSFDRAKQLVLAAARSGANAVKFQTYTPSTMTLDLDNFSVGKDHELWGGRKLFDLYKEAQTPWEWHEELFELALKNGITPFSTPFDLSALDFLESIKCPIYKIASLETGDIELITAVAETGKKVIISTGATNFEEIRDAVDAVRSTGNQNLTLLVCTSSYPAHPKDSHLLRMGTLKNEFKCEVGISDHTLGIGVSVAAVALGATVVEKHLTLSRSDGGADGEFSMEPDEFSQLVKESNSAQVSLGTPEWKIQDSEKESRRLRRSLYIVQDVAKGEIVSSNNLRAIRPGEGASPKFLKSYLGLKYKDDYPAGTPMNERLLDGIAD